MNTGRSNRAVLAGLLWLALLLALVPASLLAQRTVTTVAGGTVFDGSLATQASLAFPISVAVDSAGNVYIADHDNHRVRKIAASTGIISTFAGTGFPGFSGDGGPASSAQIGFPHGVAVDSAGNVYIADTDNQRIRVVNTTTSNITVTGVVIAPGTIATVAGNGGIVFSGDGGPATSAQLAFPNGVVVDGAGNVYIADSLNHRIRKVDASGIITTIAGTGTAGFNGDGIATSTQLDFPVDLALDSFGNLYIVDRDNNRVRKLDTSGNITTFAGGGSPTSGIGDGGPANQASLSFPQGVSVDSFSNVFIADSFHAVIRQVNTSGIITTVAGNGLFDFAGDGSLALSASLNEPADVFVKGTAELFIVDQGNLRIRKVSSGLINTIAGDFVGDGSQATQASLSEIGGVAMNAGNLFISDKSHHRIREVDSITGIILTFAGSGLTGFGQNNVFRTAFAARLRFPEGIAFDATGNLYIADTDFCRVRKVEASTGNILTIAGTGFCAFSGDGGLATSAQLSFPHAVAVDSVGNIFIADTVNNRIRKIDISGFISTVAGTGTAGFSGDGGPATSAQLDFPKGVAVDSAGNLFIADTFNNRIRKVAAGTITTVAGTGVAGFSGDGGPAASAQINFPQGIVFDGAGNLFIADSENNRIRQVNSFGTIGTVAGNGTHDFAGDGGSPTSASFRSPGAAVPDNSGNLFVADSENNLVRKVFGVLGTIAGQVAVTIVTAPQPVAGAQVKLLIAGTSIIVATTTTDSAGNYNFLVEPGSYDVQVVSRTLGTTTLNNQTASGNGSVSTANVAVTAGQLSGNVGPSVPLECFICPTFQVRVFQGGNLVAATTTGGSYSFLLLPGSYDVRASSFGFVPASSPGVTITSGVNTTLNFALPFLPQFTGAVTNASNPAPIAGAEVRALQNGLVKGSAITDQLGNYQMSVLPGTYDLVAGAGPFFTTQTVAAQSIAVGPNVTVPFSLTPIVPASRTVGTFAGAGVGDGRFGTGASLTFPGGVAVDSLGNVLIADTANDRVRRVDLSGLITTVVGTGDFGSTGDGGPALRATLFGPPALAIDGAGNLFVADPNVVRKVDSSGTITTFAGTGTPGFSGDGGPATSAQLNAPQALAVDSLGNLFIADTNNNRVRRVDHVTGIITTVAGNGTAGFSGDGGLATSAQLRFPRGVAVDNAGNFFVADSNSHRIRRVDATSGIITTFAGTGTPGFSGDGGPATSAQFNQPRGLAFDNAGDLIIADTFNNRIRVVDAASRNINTVAGSGTRGFSGDGGPATSAQLNLPQTVTVDADNSLLIADTTNSRIRKVLAATSTITTIAGGVADDGVAVPGVILGAPAGLTLDAAGDLLVSDLANSRIRKVAASNGIVTTLAGIGFGGFGGDSGPASSAAISGPRGLTFDAGGNLFFADSGNSRIRRIDTLGNISTVAGTGINGFSGDGGPATSANLNITLDVAVDAAGNLYIVDFNNRRIRVVNMTGAPITIAGVSICAGCINTVAGGGTVSPGDGGPATSASLNGPFSVVVDGGGNIFISEVNNARVHRVDASTGTITTIFNVAGSRPGALFLDAAGNLFTADLATSVVYQRNQFGTTRVVVGNGTAGSGGDGGPALSAQLSGPFDMVTNAAGNLFVAERGTERVRQVFGVLGTIAGQVAVTIGTSPQPVAGAQVKLFLAGTSALVGTTFTDPGGNYNFLVEPGSYDVQVSSSTLGTTTLPNQTASPSGTVTTANVATTGGQLSGTVSNAVTSLPIGGAAVRVFQSGGLRAATVTDSSGNYSLLLAAGTYDVQVSATGFVPGSQTGVAITGGTTTTANFTLNPLPQFVGTVTNSATTLGIGGALVQALESGIVKGSAITDSLGNYLMSVLPGTYDLVASAGPFFSTQTVATQSIAVGPNVTVLFSLTPRTPGARTIETIAGGSVGDGRFGVAASLSNPLGIVVDRFGNIIFSDFSNHRIRKVDTSGIITTIVGTGSAGFSGDGGPASSAQLNSPQGIVFDSAGNLFIADSSNNRVRRVDAASGVITTVAGTGVADSTGDGGPATSATLNFPLDVTLDNSGNLFIAEAYFNPGNRVRKVNLSTGIITAVAGTGVAGFSGDGGPATSAQLDAPEAVVVDRAGNVYIADANNARVRKVDTNGIITTIVGGGSGAACSGLGGPATSAVIDVPGGLMLDGAGNLFIAELTCGFLRVDAATGIITRIAGGGTTRPSNGLAATAAQLSGEGIAQDGAGNLVVTDSINQLIERVDPAGLLTILAGGFVGEDVLGTSVSLIGPAGGAVDSLGHTFFAERFGNRIRKLQAGGIITTFAGDGIAGFSGDAGPATAARINNPTGVAFDSAGNLYIADTFNHRVRKVDTAGNISTVAGTGLSGSTGDGGPATSATFRQPRGVAVDTAGNLYISDLAANRVRKVVLSTGIITAFAGTGTAGFSGDGGAATSAQLSTPRGLAVDSFGNLYIADTRNHLVRKVDTAGIITTFAGGGVSSTGGVIGLNTFIEGSLDTTDQRSACRGSSYFADRYTFTLSTTTTVTIFMSSTTFVDTFLYVRDSTGTCILRDDDSGGGLSSLIQASLAPGTYVIEATSFSSGATGAYSLAVVSGTTVVSTQTFNGSLDTTDPAPPSPCRGSGVGYFSDRYPFSLPAPTFVRIFMSSPTFVDTYLCLFDSAGHFIGSDDDSGGGLSSLIRRPLPAGNYVIVATSFSSGATGAYTLTLGLSNPLTTAGGTTGQATAVQLNAPVDVVVDGFGNLFIADAGTNTISQVNPFSNLRPVAGNGTAGFSGDGGPATSAQLDVPGGVAIGTNGNLFIADTFSNRIRQVFGVLGTIKGRVGTFDPLTESFTPAAGVTVQLLRNGVGLEQALTDSNGNYNFLLEPGFYDLDVTVSGQGHQTAFALQVASDGSVIFHDFTVAQPGTISGTITRADNNAPIAGALVQAIAQGETTASTRSDSSGNYSLSVPSGTYDVRAVATGFQAASQTGVSVLGNATVTVNLALTPEPVSISPAVVTGHVFNAATGLGIANATLQAFQAGVLRGSARTFPDGRFLLALPPGQYDFIVSASGFVPFHLNAVAVGTGTTTLNFNLQPVPR